MSTNEQAVNNINARLGELKNIHRIIQNTYNLVTDTDIKGGHSSAVAEILGWLNGFGKTLQTQMDALNASLPKEETAPVVDVKAEPVTSEVK